MKNRMRTFVLSVVMLVGIALGAVNPVAAGVADLVVAQGQFEGRSDHVVTGGATILKADSGYILVLEADFSLDGAPAPTLGFGTGGEFVASTEFSPLKAINGFQAYAIPASVDPTAYDEVYVWCADFSVPLGVARLN